MIKCCHGCVPPKRTPYCHIDCPKYMEEKANSEAQKVKMDFDKQASIQLTSQRTEAVRRAERHRKNRKHYSG